MQAGEAKMEHGEWQRPVLSCLVIGAASSKHPAPALTMSGESSVDLQPRKSAGAAFATEDL